jgi:hypothetical protein
LAHKELVNALTQTQDPNALIASGKVSVGLFP